VEQSPSEEGTQQSLSQSRNSPPFMELEDALTVLTRTHNWSPSWARWRENKTLWTKM